MVRTLLSLTLALGLCGCDGAAPEDAGADAGRDAGGGADAGGPIDAGVDAGHDAAVAAAPTEPGPFATSEQTGTVTRDARMTPVTAYVPDGATASPLVVFVPGFQLDSERYAALCERVASHGFVVVRADPPDPLVGVSHVAMRDDVAAVIEWARTTLPVSDAIGVMGHSLGGKVAVMTAGVVGEVDAVLGIDPVNGGSPLTGYSMDLPDVVPEVTETLALPVGYMGETTNATGGMFGMACAPAAQNFQTFYDGSTRATWAAEWTFVGADHMDFVPDTAGCGFTCTACTAGTADPASVVSSMQTLAVAFFRRHLADDASMDAYLRGASVPGDVTTRSR